MNKIFRHFALLSFILLSGSTLVFSQTITHQISLPAGDSWCSDSMINGLFNTINTFRAQNGAPALAMDTVGMKDAEIRATQFAAYMAVNQPNTPGFNPHQGWDTLAASLGYNIVSENLAYMTSDPNYIVYAVWQDTLHLNALLAKANITGVSCVFSGGIPYWTYDPGCRSTGCTGGSSPPPPQGPTSTGTPTLDSEDWAFVTLINNFRAQNGVGPLQVSVALSNSSAWMSNDMATKNYFSHTDSLGRSPGARFAAFNYPYSPWGENIAAGNSDAQSTFNQWVTACDADASGNCTFAHKQNMLYSGFVVMGIARVFNANAQYGWYWTNDFGGVVDQVISPGSGSGSGSNPAPALKITKTHSGNFTQGQQHATYSVVVSNGASAGPTAGIVTVSEQIPSGMTLVSMSGSGWSCQSSQCTRKDALGAGSSYPAITVTVNVSTNATSPQVNSVAVSGGGSVSASASDSTVITSSSSQPPLNISVSPSSGAGASQQFSFTWSDPNGGMADIQYGSVIINSTFSLQNGCWLVINVPNRTINLSNNAGTAFSALNIGSAGTIQNSQCTVNGSGSTLTGSGNNMTFVVTMNFSPSFAGLKQTYMWVQNNKGVPDSAIWQDLGSWTVTGASNQPPQNVSVSPKSGSGTSQQFTFTWSDPNGGISDIQYGSVIFNNAFSTQNGCWLVINIPNRSVYLANNAGTAYSQLNIGSSGTIQNSQCSVSGAGMSLTGSGNNMTFVVTINFSTSFAGLKQTYMWVQDDKGAPDSAIWQDLGSWNVP